MNPTHPTFLHQGMRLDDALLLVLCVGGVWSDLRSRRIANAWNGGFMLAGLLAAALAGGVEGLLSGLGGLALGFVFLYPMFAAGGMGGGDVKFCMAIGAVTGWRFLISTAIFSGLTMAAQSCLQIWWISQAFGGLLAFLTLRQQELRDRVPPAEQKTALPWVPYAVGISAGALLARVSGWSPLGG